MARDEQGRKTGRNFASLRATFSRSTLTVNEGQAKDNLKKTTSEEVAPAPKVKQPERRQSKYTLFDLFAKPKVQTARGYHESGLSTVAEHAPPPKQPPAIEEQPGRSVDPVTSRTSRKSALLPVSTSQTSRITQPRIEPPQGLEYWGAPPLFQAYPQSVRHGVLQSPVVSLDALIRAQHLRRQGGYPGNSPTLSSVREGGDNEAAQEMGKLVSRRFSTINDTPELADKIFVLVTAGRLVQYAGDGNYDRMPEKVLQLGDKSAAFACDLVPGKHWVVQVVQQVNADEGGQMNKSRSLLSRLRNPAANRKSTANVLLVFKSAEDMDGWLKAIRHVIEKLGGAKRQADGEAHAIETPQQAPSTEEPLSHRYRVSRPTSMISTTSTQRPRSVASFSQPRSPRALLDMELPPIPTNSHLASRVTPGNSPKEINFPAEVQSPGTTASSYSPLDSSVASSDHIQLEQLREGSHTSALSIRTSRTSDTDHGTVLTSKSSSSPPSPRVEIFSEQQSGVEKSMRTMQTTPASDIRRLSIQPTVSSEPVGAGTMTKMKHAATEQESSSPIESSVSATLDALSRNSEIPQPRTSELSSNAMPVKLRLSELFTRQDSDLKEPWNREPRPDSVLGQLPSIPARSMSRRDSAGKPRRPLPRMLPVRPSEPNGMPSQRTAGPTTTFVPRRYSSLPSTTTISEMQGNSVASSQILPISSSLASPFAKSSPSEESNTQSSPPRHRARVPSLPLSINPPTNTPQQAYQQMRALRRPTSLQIRSDPTPFLSQRRPSISNQPSQPTASSNSYFAGSMPTNDFIPNGISGRASGGSSQPANLPGNRPMEAVAPEATPTILPPDVEPNHISFSPPTSSMTQNRPLMRTRNSMAGMMLSGLPPPAPPPDMPLPSLPKDISFPPRPPSMPHPSRPPTMPLPSLPPNIPLPPIPTHGIAL